MGGDQSLIQATVDRLTPLIPPEHIWILTNDYRARRDREAASGSSAKQILAEPAQRNTAPAIGLAAHILHSIDPEAVFGVFPSDHVIAQAEALSARRWSRRFEAAETGKIAVLGIQPRWAETGYGYIEFRRGVRAGARETSPVLSFREKPDLRRPPKSSSRRALSSGTRACSSGGRTVLLETCAITCRRPRRCWRACRPLRTPISPAACRKCFPLCENISIDYAVLEKATNVVGVACGEFGWNDVGSWDAVYELLPRDAARQRPGPTCWLRIRAATSCKRGKKLVALLGVKDLIVVDTPDALLIADRQARAAGGRPGEAAGKAAAGEDLL